MDENQLVRKVHKEYEKIEGVWRELHWYVMLVVGAAITLIELFMFFSLLSQNALPIPPFHYLMQYVLLPTCLSAALLLGCHFCLYRIKLQRKRLSYILSLVFVCICFVLGLFYSMFPAVSLVFALPIMMTVTYGNKALTTTTALLCTLSLILTSLVFGVEINNRQEDPSNVAISAVILLGIYAVSMVIMLFQKRKQAAAIKNDLERHRLRLAVLTDDLTGVLNKQALREYFERMVSDDSGVPYYLAMIDVDNFKQLNDLRGHVYGDEVLRKLGKVLTQHQKYGTAFRFGGDEFCVLFYGLLEEETQKALESIRNKYRSAMKEDGSSLSIGVAKYRFGTRPKVLLEEADRALYLSKRGNKDSLHFFDAEDTEEISTTSTPQNEISKK